MRVYSTFKSARAILARCIAVRMRNYRVGANAGYSCRTEIGVPTGNRVMRCRWVSYQLARSSSSLGARLRVAGFGQ